LKETLNMRSISVTAVIIAGSLGIATPAFGDQGAGKDKHAQVADRVKQLRAELLRKRLGLDAGKAAEVERVLDRNAPRRAELQRELRLHRKALRELLDKNSDDQAQYSRELQALRKAQNELHTLRQREFDELAKILTPKQQAKLVAALRQFHRQMRDPGDAEK
jgi:vacuolar-type H+-ATPase subunit I/STV1